MKMLLLLAVVFFAAWLWRRGRIADRQVPAQRPSVAPELADMVQCPYCQLHLPSEEAAQGALGFYCSEAHRAAAGDRPKKDEKGH